MGVKRAPCLGIQAVNWQLYHRVIGTHPGVVRIERSSSRPSVWPLASSGSPFLWKPGAQASYPWTWHRPPKEMPMASSTQTWPCRAPTQPNGAHRQPTDARAGAHPVGRVNSPVPPTPRGVFLSVSLLPRLGALAGRQGGRGLTHLPGGPQSVGSRNA